MVLIKGNIIDFPWDLFFPLSQKWPSSQFSPLSLFTDLFLLFTVSVPIQLRKRANSGSNLPSSWRSLTHSGPPRLFNPFSRLDIHRTEGRRKKLGVKLVQGLSFWTTATAIWRSDGDKKRRMRNEGAFKGWPSSHSLWTMTSGATITWLAADPDLLFLLYYIIDQLRLDSFLSQVKEFDLMHFFRSKQFAWRAKRFNLSDRVLHDV